MRGWGVTHHFARATPEEVPVAYLRSTGSGALRVFLSAVQTCSRQLVAIEHQRVQDKKEVLVAPGGFFLWVHIERCVGLD